MARSQSYDDQDPLEEQTSDVTEDIAAEAEATEATEAAEANEATEPCDEAAEDADELATLPNLDDLESQGFTPEQVRRLVVVSDRAADSSESRAAEAELRRLRFTRWLIEHGVLDEWSA